MIDPGIYMWTKEQLQEMVQEQRNAIHALYADKRDQFAMAALTGLLANPKLQDAILKKGGANSGWIEQSAYAFADAMMKTREAQSAL